MHGQYYEILRQAGLLLIFTVLLGSAILLLSIYNKLFPGIRNNWLRKNLVVLLLSLLFLTALSLLSAISMELTDMKQGGAMWRTIFIQLLWSELLVFLVFNFVLLITRIPAVRKLPFIGYHAVVILAIIVSSILFDCTLEFLKSDMHLSMKKVHQIIVFCYYNSLATGLIFAGVSYVELNRKRKLSEKELELTRLTALKTKAELDALHSKVNPHFLYNALNSIADLSITDGRKARRMTIALADLFRYSINYSNNNFSTVNDEVAMTEVYLQIEKIRFEDQLNYTVHVDEGAGFYLVPRFILQPLVENAVKHGLKRTGKITEIRLDVNLVQGGLQISVADNGPDFPDNLVPGYGVKSVFDKLDLLFPNQYTIRFRNNPQKEVSIEINKLIKNEPGI